jgi:hypothetical protein
MQGAMFPKLEAQYSLICAARHRNFALIHFRAADIPLLPAEI